MFSLINRDRLLPVFLGSLAVLVSQTTLAADAEVEAALQKLLGSAEVSAYLTLRRGEEIESGEYEVRPGDTLDSLIHRAFAGSGIRRDFLRQAFITANPRAFRNGNPNWLLAGVTLRIPTQQDLLNVVFEDPAQIDSAASQRHWIRYP